MNPILLDLGIVKIYWYSVMIFIGLLVGGILAIRESKRWKIPEDFMINYFFFLVPLCLIGARLYYVLFNLDYYSSDWLAILRVWEGGLAIHGGIIAGVLWTLFYCKRYKVNFFRLADIMVVSLIIGQAIGRWGNFFNQEAFGPVTTLEFLNKLHLPNFIIDNMYIDGAYHQPTFLYESIWCLLGFIFLLIIRKYRYTKIGQVTGLYFIWYGFGRFFIESLRTDSLMLGGLKMAQLVSLLMILLGLGLIILLQKKSVFKNQYNDKENVDEIKF